MKKNKLDEREVVLKSQIKTLLLTKKTIGRLTDSIYSVFAEEFRKMKS